MSIFGSTVVTSEDGGTEITSLPFTADVPGHTYYLTRDLTCSDSGAAGITVAADSITIDGKGYKITGSATPSDCEWFGETEPCTASGIYNSGYDNVVIRNIKITGFGTGIALKGTAGNKIQNNIVDNCEIYDNGFSITSGGSEMVTHGIHACWLAQGNPSTPVLKIINCDIYDNKGTGSSCGDGGNGIFIYAGSPESKDEYVVISNNRLHGNDKAGFWAKMMLSKSQISNNIVYENGNGEGVTDPIRGGIVLRCRLSDFNTVKGNRIYDNNGDGIYVGGNSNEFIENIVRDNHGNGIDLGRSDGSQNNELYYNYICGHTGSCYDVNNFYADGGRNTGDNNAGSTAYNYHDKETSGFTYPCNPDTTIIDGPSGTIKYNDVMFRWTGDGYVTPSQGLQFSYKLEGYDNSWSSWMDSTSKTYPDLDNGQYIFKVKSKDAVGNIDPAPAIVSFTVNVSTSDTTPPDTTITDGPTGIIEYNDVTFTWNGSDDTTSSANLRYSYKLVGYDSSWSSWTKSTSKSYNNLPNGQYTFKVKAKDEADNIDPSPAQRLFTIDVSTSDTTPPDTTITDGPTGIIEYNDVTFTWNGSDDITSPSNIIYSYKLQGYDSSWSSWTTSKSKSYTDLDNGKYTFKVKAKDESGNIDPTPAERTFVINTSIDLKTYHITWDIAKKEIQLDDLFVNKSRLKIEISKEFPFIKVIRKDNPFVKIVRINEYNLKSINIKLTWNDDLTTPVFPYGKD
ncbi:MAG: right-handed parallel beta-helix repeat-containing protein, partial [Thermoplasmata archaeon]|nr:right-handed parallel beta-helix repeat-containing protein [Thermoplasmata archaeon]